MLALVSCPPPNTKPVLTKHRQSEQTLHKYTWRLYTILTGKYKYKSASNDSLAFLRWSDFLVSRQVLQRQSCLPIDPLLSPTGGSENRPAATPGESRWVQKSHKAFSTIITQKTQR